MGDTSIQWTHYTFNPWLGCSKVHAGCTHCYAEKHQAVNMRKGGAVKWGEVWTGGQRVVVSESTWRKPFQWAREAAKAGDRRRVFCASLADVLDVPAEPPKALGQPAYSAAMHKVMEARHVLDEARARLWDLVRQTATLHNDGTPYDDPALGRDALIAGGIGPHGLDWLLLTKRPENWALVPEDVRPLVWLGTSVADQQTADELVPRLLCSQGFRYRFISAEPLVGPLDLRGLRVSPICVPGGEADGCGEQPLCDAFDRSERCGCTSEGAEPISWDRLDWVIVGGESGPRARPFNVEWAEDLVRQCREAGVACFVKQLGAYVYDPREGFRYSEPHPGGPAEDPDCRLHQVDPKGGDWDEWDDTLRVRQWPDTFRGERP